MPQDPDNVYASDVDDSKNPFATHNPYAAPAEIDDIALPGDVQLATRGARFAGAFVDGLIMLPAAFGIYVVAFNLGATGVFGTNMLAAQIAGGLIGAVLASLWYLIVNGYLLSTRGQTIGKLTVGTRIVDSETNEILPLWPLFLKRWVVVQLIAVIPLFGNLFNLANILMIFRSNRKCLHDDIAGTKVIQVSK
ncbi:MAG: RDD family protein [Fuerstiella sp.]